MKRVLMFAVAAAASVLVVASPASARLGMAPLAAANDGVIQVRHGGHGHGHGHWGHHGRGHHYGWYRGRHRGWHHHHHR